MTTKAALLIICIFFLAACQPDLETIEVTPRPTFTATAMALDTAVPPTATHTALPPTPFPTATPEPTATLIPSPTVTPAPSLPSASVLFMRDNALQQWIPQTGEVKTLVENVTGDIIYSADTAVFLREIVPDQESALIVFHIPTQSEYELFKTSVTPLVGLYDESVSISPNGRWLAYVSGDSRDSATLMVHEITVEDQQVTVSSPVLTVVPGNGWTWPYDQLTWPTENEISWNDQAGIWVADLTTNPIEPVVAIAPSTNTFLLPPLNPADSDKGPDTVFTDYIPYLWSPDGRFLLVKEYFFEYSEFRIIERGTNRAVEVPESNIGPISDNAIWFDENTLLHYKFGDSVKLWQINFDNDPPLTLENSIPLEYSSEMSDLMLIGNHLRFNFYYLDDLLYDLDLETGELTQLIQSIPHSLHLSPNGQHVLWSNSSHSNGEWFGHVYLDDLNGDKPVEMGSVFGLNSCCWHWYEE